MLKQVIVFLTLLIAPVLLRAQQIDSLNSKSDSIGVKDSTIKRGLAIVNQPDSGMLKPDSLVKKDTVINKSAYYNLAFQKVLKENGFLNSAGNPVAMGIQIKKQDFFIEFTPRTYTFLFFSQHIKEDTTIGFMEYFMGSIPTLLEKFFGVFNKTA